MKTGNWSSHSHRERWVADWNAQHQPLPVGLSTRSCHHMTRARELQPLLWGLLASPQLNPEWRVPCAPADSAHRGLMAGDPPRPGCGAPPRATSCTPGPDWHLASPSGPQGSHTCSSHVSSRREDFSHGSHRQRGGCAGTNLPLSLAYPTNQQQKARMLSWLAGGGVGAQGSRGWTGG